MNIKTFILCSILLGGCAAQPPPTTSPITMDSPYSLELLELCLSHGQAMEEYTDLLLESHDQNVEEYNELLDQLDIHNAAKHPGEVDAI